MDIKYIINKLEYQELNYRSFGNSETFIGNKVKEAHYFGMAAGIRASINVLNEYLE